MIETTNDVLDLEGAREFALLPGLRRLYLNHTPVDDEMFAVLVSLGSLEHLELGYTRLTPASSTILSGLTNLTNLMWPSSAITLLNVNDFSVLTNLKELQVVGGINDRLILDQINRELCKVLPNCYVDVWDI